MIGSEVLGDVVGLAGQVTAAGLLVWCAASVPIQSVVTVHFGPGTDAELVARAEVVRHLAEGGMVLRILDFDDRLPSGTPLLH